jgi:hypothetical protein
VFLSGSTAVDFDAIAGTCEKALFVAVDLESRFDLLEVHTPASSLMLILRCWLSMWSMS